MAPADRAKERDVPDYKPVPLRTWYLGLLFVFICSLIGGLEYLAHILPHAQDRTSVLNDFKTEPTGTPQQEQEQPLRRWQPASPASRPPTDASHPSATPVTHLPNTPGHEAAKAGPAPTPFPSVNARGVAAVAVAAPRPPSTEFLDGNPSRKYVTWANQWVRGATDRVYDRKPVFPGDDVAGQCVYYHHGIIETTDTSACAAFIGSGDGDSSPPPQGWINAWWLDSDIWFPPDGCDDPDAWYSGYPSNHTWPTIEIKNEDTTNLDVYNPWKAENLFPGVIDAIEHCTKAPAGARVLSKRRPSNIGSILRMYGGIFNNPPLPDGGLDWGSRPFQVRATPDNRDVPELETQLRANERFWANPVPVPEDWSKRKLDKQMSATGSSASGHGTSISSAPATASSGPEPSDRGRPATSTGGRDPDRTTDLPSPKVVEVEVPRYSTETTKYIVVGPSGTTTTQRRIPTGTATLLVVLPAILAPATVVTTTDERGHLATTTKYGGDVVLHTTTSTFRDARGSPTTTATTVVPITSVVKTMTDPRDGAPTATVTLFPIYPVIPGAKPADIVIPQRGNYFTVYFLPVLLTALLSVPIQAVDAELKALFPLRLLTRPGGSAAALPLHPSAALAGVLALWRHRDPLALLGDLMVLCASLLVALSGETIGLKLRGSCGPRDLHSCFVTVAAFPGAVRTAETLLAVLAVLVLVLAVVLRRWKTGVAAHPSSVAAMCAMLQAPQAQDVFRAVAISAFEDDGDRRLRDSLKDTAFRLGRYSPAPRADDYGLVPVAPADSNLPGVSSAMPSPKPAQTKQEKESGSPWGAPLQRTKTHIKGSQLVKSGRLLQGLFLAALCALLVVVLYYENTVLTESEATPFERFMDSQEFGVRMLFTTCGVLIGLAWETLFSNFAKRALYYRMALSPQPASLSVLEPQSTTVFAGLWRAVRRRDALLGTVALAGVLARFLPLFLAGVPFAPAQTFSAHEICTWAAVAALALMVVALLTHMWVATSWPLLPVAPESLAAAAYYVCDSAMLRDFERLSMMGARERDRRVAGMERRYRFGWMTGVSGMRRIGIDYVEGERGFRMRKLSGLGTTMDKKRRK